MTRLHTPFPNVWSEKQKKPCSKWLGGHESKHTYYIFISIHYQLNPPRDTDAKPQFASKISSLDVSNDLRTYSPRRTTVENRL